ncbi:MAG: hypothetical protein IKY29_03110, partial [Clostridia bacterium]|nr:hypothetical protein [Clostridia bacterium]
QRVLMLCSHSLKLCMLLRFRPRSFFIGRMVLLSPFYLCRAAKEQFPKAAGLWLIFFRPFFVQRQSKDINADTAHAQRCVRVKRRRCKKFQLSPAPHAKKQHLPQQSAADAIITNEIFISAP